jgi:hypothetical protein
VCANTSELAGFLARLPVSVETKISPAVILAARSLAQKSRFPGTGDYLVRDRV